MLLLEKNFRKNPTLAEQYKKFMYEYEKLGHMQKIDKTELAETHCFLPHFGVERASSTTTKLRVVFDASAKTSNGFSLNDILEVGPRIQSELFDLLIRFRKFKYAFTADIEKMYRQIKINENDTNMQMIVWRDNENEEMQFFNLNTVTYGTASAPYLATRTLVKMASENAVDYPLASKIIKNDFYMDDFDERMR